MSGQFRSHKCQEPVMVQTVAEAGRAPVARHREEDGTEKGERQAGPSVVDHRPKESGAVWGHATQGDQGP